MSARTTKKKIMTEVAARALHSIIHSIESRDPGLRTPKRNLIFRAVKRAEDIREDEFDAAHDLDAIPAPDENFFKNNWSFLCKLLAKKYKTYLVWGGESFKGGLRLGTLEEYQNDQYLMKEITDGIGDSLNDRARIIVGHGGQSFLVDVKVKELGPGELVPENGSSSDEEERTHT